MIQLIQLVDITQPQYWQAHNNSMLLRERNKIDFRTVRGYFSNLSSYSITYGAKAGKCNRNMANELIRNSLFNAK